MAEIAIAIFASKRQAEDAITTLIDRNGYSLNRFSIVSKEYLTEERAIRFYNTADRVRRWSPWAALWGFIWGLFLGPIFAHTPLGNNLPGIVHVPELGHYFSFHVYSSPFGWLLGSILTAAIFASIAAFASWLVSIGIPRNSLIEYESNYRPQTVELMFDGTEEEALQAKSALRVETREQARI